MLAVCKVVSVSVLLKQQSVEGAMIRKWDPLTSDSHTSKLLPNIPWCHISLIHDLYFFLVNSCIYVHYKWQQPFTKGKLDRLQRKIKVRTEYGKKNKLKPDRKRADVPFMSSESGSSSSSSEESSPSSLLSIFLSSLPTLFRSSSSLSLEVSSAFRSSTAVGLEVSSASSSAGRIGHMQISRGCVELHAGLWLQLLCIHTNTCRGSTPTFVTQW